MIGLGRFMISLVSVWVGSWSAWVNLVQFGSVHGRLCQFGSVHGRVGSVHGHFVSVWVGSWSGWVGSWSV